VARSRGQLVRRLFHTSSKNTSIYLTRSAATKRRLGPLSNCVGGHGVHFIFDLSNQTSSAGMYVVQLPSCNNLYLSECVTSNCMEHLSLVALVRVDRVNRAGMEHHCIDNVYTTTVPAEIAFPPHWGTSWKTPHWVRAKVQTCRDDLRIPKVAPQP
jgi:hypothetical protein